MGVDDQNAAWENRQLHQEPLELYNEKEEHRPHGNTIRYFTFYLDLIIKKKTCFLNKNEVGEHPVKI